VPQLSDNLRGLSFDTLFPVVLAGSSITRRWWPPRAASLAGYQAVKRDIEAATSRILEGALLAREAVPKASEDKFQAHYARQYVGKLATKEARAKHILVSTEAADRGTEHGRGFSDARQAGQQGS
jgi:hypothetical protein